MKKFTLVSSALLLVAVTVFVAVGCQKEQTASTEKKIVSDEVVVSNGSAPIIGIINRDHADEMAAAFAKKFPGVKTQSVGYSTKNLIAYLTVLLTKYNSDSVYVNFGLYDEKTAPKPSYIGRSTIFFMGKDMQSRSGSGSVRVLGGEGDGGEGRYLNQGEVFP